MTDAIQELPSRKYPAWLLPLALATLVAFFMQGTRGLFETTEGRYAECAREMAAGGYLEPMLNGQHHWTKPPLTYWAIHAGAAVFGNSPWGVRFYLAVSFILTVAAVHVLEGALWRRPATGYAALIYATAPFTIASAQAVSTDALLAMWEAWALAFYWLAAQSKRNGFIWLFWAALGMAFATKGPVGLFPLLGVVPTQIYLRRRGEARPALWHPAGLLLFCMLGFWWYALMIARYPELIRYWFVGELVDRVLTDTYDRNSNPITILTMYLPIIVFGTGPWLLWVLFKLRRNLRWRNLRALCAEPGGGAGYFFIAFSIALPFLLFAVSESRLPLYMTPLFVPLALAAGRALERLSESGVVNPRNVVRVALVMALVGCVGKAIAAQKKDWKDMTTLARLVESDAAYSHETPVAVLGGAPLNGLSFHLGRRVPAFKMLIDNPEDYLNHRDSDAAFPSLVPEANADLLLAGQDATILALEAGTIVILRRPEFEKFGPAFHDTHWRVLNQNEKWTLLRLEAPFSVPLPASGPVAAQE